MKRTIAVMCSLLLAATAVGAGESEESSAGARHGKLIGGLVGAIGGGLLGYFIGGSLSADESLDDIERQFTGLLLGATAGGITGMIVGGRIDDRQVDLALARERERLQQAQIEVAPEVVIAELIELPRSLRTASVAHSISGVGAPHERRRDAAHCANAWQRAPR